MINLTIMSEQTCKGCGLGVQPGYPKCPRCHMPLPRAQTSTSAELSGGTAVDSESSSRSLWIGGGAVAMVVVGILVFSKGDEEATQEEPTEEPVAALVTPTAVPTDTLPVGIDTTVTGSDLATKRLAALQALETQLNGHRLWATVTMDDGSDSVVSVVSGACEEKAMKPTIVEQAAGLQELGISSVLCRAKHGALVFEQSL